jgi:hypothetical protein
LSLIAGQLLMSVGRYMRRPMGSWFGQKPRGELLVHHDHGLGLAPVSVLEEAALGKLGPHGSK